MYYDDDTRGKKLEILNTPCQFISLLHAMVLQRDVSIVHLLNSVHYNIHFNVFRYYLKSYIYVSRCYFNYSHVCETFLSPVLLERDLDVTLRNEVHILITIQKAMATYVLYIGI